jgi:hypothetical protein
MDRQDIPNSPLGKLLQHFWMDRVFSFSSRMISGSECRMLLHNTGPYVGTVAEKLICECDTVKCCLLNIVVISVTFVCVFFFFWVSCHCSRHSWDIMGSLQIILICRYINLRLEPLVKLIQDKCLLVDFLLQRKDSKPVVIQVHSFVSYCVFVF